LTAPSLGSAFSFDCRIDAGRRLSFGPGWGLANRAERACSVDRSFFQERLRFREAAWRITEGDVTRTAALLSINPPGRRALSCMKFGAGVDKLR